MNRNRQALLWPLQFADYAWFVFFMGVKLYLFGKFAGIHFTSLDIVKVTAGSVLLASFWTLPLPRWGRPATLWTLGLVFSFTVFADLVYYRYFSDFITVPVIMQAGQVGAVGGSIKSLIQWQDIVFFADLIVAAPFVLLLRKRWRLPWTRLTVRISMGLLTACIGFVLVYQPIHAYTAKWGKNLFVNNWWNVSIYNVTGLLGFHYFDAKKFLEERVFGQNKPTGEKIAADKTWFDDHRKALQAENALFGTQKGKNVLIIQTEAFQNFVIGKSIGGKEITPNLNKLINEVAYFDNFHHQVGQGRTVDAEFLVNNSLYPLPTGSVYRRFPTNAYDSLPEVLKEQGYSTYAFHAFEKSFWNRQVMYQNYNLDYFYGQGDFAPGEKVGWDLGDESMLNQTIDKLLETKKPFYSLAVTLSSHHPFTNIPQKYKELDTGDLEGTLEGNYLHAVHYVDYSFGKFVERMKSEGLWDTTIVAIYGDHDAGLQQYDKLGEKLGFTADDLTILEMKNEVPLFLHLPGAEEPGVHHQSIGMIDMTPTILNLLGVPFDGKYYMGDNLFAKNGQTIAFRYGSFTDGKVFYKASPDGKFENGICYDFESRQQTDMNACKPGFDESIRQLGISDDVILNDLLKKFKK